MRPTPSSPMSGRARGSWRRNSSTAAPACWSATTGAPDGTAEALAEPAAVGPFRNTDLRRHAVMAEQLPAAALWRHHALHGLPIADRRRFSGAGLRPAAQLAARGAGHDAVDRLPPLRSF